MLFPKFRKYVTEHGLIEKGDSVLLAVSGGIDSMVLLHLVLYIAKAFELKVFVAHVNHKLRSKASDTDELLVCKFCKLHNVPIDVLKKKPPSGTNLQDAARKMRYNFLKSVAEKRKVSKILTAHHMDDQTETILLHLLRGGGLKGLAGMKPKLESGEMFIVRPLLFALKSEIKAYAKKNRIKYRNDATNALNKYKRNEIRHDLLPLLEKFNPRIVQTLAKMGERMAGDDDALELFALEALNQSLIRTEKNKISIQRDSFTGLPPAIRTRILRLIFERVSGSAKDLNSDQLKRMDEISLSSRKEGAYRLPSSWKFVCEGNELSIIKSSTNCDRSN